VHIYEVRPRKDRRGVDLISDVLPFGRLWYDTPDNAIGYAMHSSRSHDAVIRVYDDAGNLIETQGAAPYAERLDFHRICDLHCTVTATGTEGMPFATTTSVLGPSSCVAGTSK